MNIAKTTIVTCLYLLFMQSELTVASDDSSTVNFQTANNDVSDICLLYTSPSPRDKRQSRMPSSA